MRERERQPPRPQPVLPHPVTDPLCPTYGWFEQFVGPSPELEEKPLQVELAEVKLLNNRVDGLSGQCVIRPREVSPLRGGQTFRCALEGDYFRPGWKDGHIQYWYPDADVHPVEQTLQFQFGDIAESAKVLREGAIVFLRLLRVVGEWPHPTLSAMSNTVAVPVGM